MTIWFNLNLKDKHIGFYCDGEKVITIGIIFFNENWDVNGYFFKNATQCTKRSQPYEIDRVGFELCMDSYSNLILVRIFFVWSNFLIKIFVSLFPCNRVNKLFWREMFTYL